MRWELLFADLESLAEAADRADLEGDVADRVRAEHGRLHLVDRIRAHQGERLVVRLLGGDRLAGRLADVGADWLLLDDGASNLVPLAAVGSVDGLTPAAVPPERAGLGVRVTLSIVLRRLARDRAGVGVRLRDGTVLNGTVDRVGADHLDLAVHPAEGVRRAGSVRGVVVIPVVALLVVRSTG